MSVRSEQHLMSSDARTMKSKAKSRADGVESSFTIYTDNDETPFSSSNQHQESLATAVEEASAQAIDHSAATSLPEVYRGDSTLESPTINATPSHHQSPPTNAADASMPYNNTAIPPPEEITGSTSLPLARVKKILQLDEDIAQCSNNAAFTITMATEMFVRYFAEQAHNVVKSERKPRRNIQYKDLANAVARVDNLEFLSDVIPRTMTYREYKEKKARTSKGPRPLPQGQTTLDGSRPHSSHIAEQVNANDAVTDERTVSPEDSPDELGVPPASNGVVNSNSNLVFEHYEPNGNGKRDESGDVEME